MFHEGRMSDQGRPSRSSLVRGQEPSTNTTTKVPRAHFTKMAGNSLVMVSSQDASTGIKCPLPHPQHHDGHLAQQQKPRTWRTSRWSVPQRTSRPPPPRWGRPRGITLSSCEVLPAVCAVGKHGQPRAPDQQVQHHGGCARAPSPQQRPQHHEQALRGDGQLPLKGPNLWRQPRHERESEADERSFFCPNVPECHVPSEHPGVSGFGAPLEASPS